MGQARGIFDIDLRNRSDELDLEVGLPELEAPTQLELTKLNQMKVKLFKGIGHITSSLSTGFGWFSSGAIITVMPALWQPDLGGSNGASDAIVDVIQ